ncbi:hypothetical protein F4677DRAFT_399898 [Hypoxylon crocopeplum]|nr:hypothetical protein F4677DRAFT_399898 [Hypoxylon crocopeplum]
MPGLPILFSLIRRQHLFLTLLHSFSSSGNYLFFTFSRSFTRFGIFYFLGRASFFAYTIFYDLSVHITNSR